MSQEKIIHRTMLGKVVDMNKLMNQQELTLTVGNVKMNARGDEIGPGGKIIPKHIDHTMSSNTPIEVKIPQPQQVQPVIEQPTIKPSKTPKDASDTTTDGV